MAINVKLGKAPAKKDKNTIKLKKILAPSALPELPKQFDVDVDDLKMEIPLQMYGNDTYGDCVMVGRANWTLRAEAYEQKKVLPITTEEILTEYWTEGTGGIEAKSDNGLVMLDSLNEWKGRGWKTSGNDYQIYAFAAIDVKNPEELKYAVYLLNGGYIGITVTDRTMEQFENGEVWDVVPKSYPEGGHCIYICGYNEIGPVCITWGKKQQMTWQFYKKYCDEAYAVIDKADAFVENSPVDVVKLQGYLNKIESLPHH